MTAAVQQTEVRWGACHADNGRHVMRWIILRTFLINGSSLWSQIMVSLLPISSHVALPLISEQTETSAAALVLSEHCSHHITSHHFTSHHFTSHHIKEDKKARNVSTTTIDVVRHAICQVWGLILSSKWRFLRKERTWWLINDVEHQKTILLESLTAGWLILKTVSKCHDMTFYSSQSLSKLSSICITLTHEVCAHITCILTFWQP